MLMSKLAMTAEAAWNLPARGVYSAHQAITEAIDGPALWRAGSDNVLALSEREPRPTERWAVLGVKPYEPRVVAGELLRFSIRANATVCRDGKRHDLINDARRRGDQRPAHELADALYLPWLQRQGERLGFELIDARVGRRTRNSGFKPGCDITFWTVDFEGILRVQDSQSFVHTLMNGLGHARSFGAGLLLVTRAH